MSADPTAMGAAVLIAATGIAVSAAEDLHAYAVFRTGDLLAWPVARLRAPWLERGTAARLLNAAFDGDRYRGVLAVSALVALSAPAALAWPAFLPVVSVALLACVVVQGLRTLYGMDGSDQMNLVLLSGTSIWALAPEHSSAREFAAWFVAGQLALAYFVSGAAKLTSSQWRRGSALVGVMSTGHYGDERIHRVLVRLPALSLVLGWAVMLLEVAFPVVFLLPLGPRAAVFAAMASFHIGCALLMGLNNFMFAFLAAYPVAFACATSSHAAIFG